MAGHKLSSGLHNVTAGPGCSKTTGIEATLGMKLTAGISPSQSLPAFLPDAFTTGQKGALGMFRSGLYLDS